MYEYRRYFMDKKVGIIISDILDTIKEFIIKWGLRILAVLLFLMIIHNVLKMAEVSNNYTGEYKSLKAIYGPKDMMNIYTVRRG